MLGEVVTQNIGLPALNSVKLLQSIGQTGISIDRNDIIGLIAGAVLGWMVAKKWPNMVVKYVGVIVGAEMGILVARMLKPSGGTTV